MMSDSSPQATAFDSGEPIPDGIYQLRRMREMWAEETRIAKQRTAILIEESKRLIEAADQKVDATAFLPEIRAND